jgi:hypothetical protein
LIPKLVVIVLMQPMHQINLMLLMLMLMLMLMLKPSTSTSLPPLPPNTKPRPRAPSLRLPRTPYSPTPQLIQPQLRFEIPATNVGSNRRNHAPFATTPQTGSELLLVLVLLLLLLLLLLKNDGGVRI